MRAVVDRYIEVDKLVLIFLTLFLWIFLCSAGPPYCDTSCICHKQCRNPA
jgi:hypothetical protein